MIITRNCETIALENNCENNIRGRCVPRVNKKRIQENEKKT